MTRPAPFRYLKTSAEIIRLAVLRYIRFPLLRRNVEDRYCQKKPVCWAHRRSVVGLCGSVSVRMGVFARMMDGLAARAVVPKEVMIDATYLKAHLTASGLRSKRGIR